MRLFAAIFLLTLRESKQETKDGVCYNAAGEAVRCMPDFVNIAFQAQVFASNTCGDPPSEFCVQQEIGLPNLDDQNCYICDENSKENKHPPSYLTDRNEVDNQTWWQSNTLYDQNIENMTLHLPFNKSFDIEYIKIEFNGPRPESMVIEKSSDYGRNWEVYQYFSSSCYKTFNKKTDDQIFPWDETKAICTGKYSEISPLQGGVVAFSPLKNRPSAKETEQLFNTPLLLSWMRATDIRIRLLRLNTFGDQYFSNQKSDVLKTYYYAISDLSVGGRCTCHGHGGYCSRDSCACEHNTAGKNCERCMDMFNDLDWKQSTVEEPFVCQECDCNGLATRCVFDESAFIKSSNVSGGVCVGCRANTAGNHCEACAHGYYPNPQLPVGHIDRCVKCECNVYGSVGDGACAQELDFNRNLGFGDCQCKPHVLGINCETCEDGYHSLQEGCSRCDCDPVGTKGDHTICDKANGQCDCIANIAGKQCNECLPGFWGYLSGCKQCSCDPVGSSSKSCDQETGQCPCRKGRDGKFCSEIQEGTFKPDMDTIVIKPDPVPVIDGSGVDGDGDGGEIDGDGDEDGTEYGTEELPERFLDGKATLSDKGDEVKFSGLEPSRAGPYTIKVKYGFPIEPEENVRVKFELISASSSGTSSPDCVALETQTWEEMMVYGEDVIFELIDACLSDDTTYTLKITLEDDVEGGIIVHGIVVVPTPSAGVIEQLDDVFPDNEAGQEALQHCLDIIYEISSLELETKFPECVVVSDIIVNDITNGSVACNCNREGAYDPDTCERIGGQCACKPNVYGLKCDKCKPGYTSLGMTGCSECDCSDIGSLTGVCHVDTGVCSCKTGVTGGKCTECEAGMYGFGSKGCAECGCNVVGSTSQQCDLRFGECQCKPGVAGMHCDRCGEGYYDFSMSGCKQCECNSIGGSNLCDPVSGECTCKENVEGDRCLTCKDDSFSLQQSNPDGCQACFCYGHSTACVGDTSYTPERVVSDFKKSGGGWKYRRGDSSKLHEPEHMSLFEHVRVTNDGEADQTYCLVAPEKYKGNQLGSFLTALKFTYNIRGSQSGISEIMIRGNPYTLSLIPRVNPGDRYKTSMHHTASWLISDTGSENARSDRITATMFQSVIGDISSIEICTTVFANEALYLEEFSIGGVIPKPGRNAKTAYNMEECACPEGYSGSSCGECDAGYKRVNVSLGHLSRCVECECSGYSDVCDADTGACIDCSWNTAGDFCEVCEEGYYGTPGYGNPSSCKQCQCPDAERSFSNTCELQEGRMVCTNCTRGHTGDRCDECDDGFYGEPSYDNVNQHCTECTCNGNIDVEAADNCNTRTGQCLQCVGNTAGRYCEECARGYHGDAVQDKNCTRCSCSGEGSYNQYLCDVESGQCDCKPHVVGTKCDRCQAGYYDLDSGSGCTSCQCDFLGSSDLQCSEDGSCLCRAGYFGVKCDECGVNFFYDPIKGCSACDCDPEGSESQQCDDSGQCQCKGTVQGKRCDMCPRNMVDISLGCVNCPDCYSLVEREVSQLKEKLEELRVLMENMDTPTIEANPDFKNQIEEVQVAVRDTFEQANETAALATQLNAAKSEIKDLIETLKREMDDTNDIIGVVSNSVESSERKLGQAIDAIDNIEQQLDDGVRMLLKEGEAALQTAQENMDTLSQENMEMQKKANQARKIAQEQQEKSQQTVKMAKEAEDLSTDALNTAKNARNTLKETQSKLESLTADIGELKEEYELAQNAATNYISSAEDTLKSAEQLKEQACSSDGEVDLTSLSESLEELEDKATTASNDATALKQQANQMIEDAAKTIDTAEKLLTDGEEADEGMSQLKLEAEDALKKSKEAVEECKDLISDAEKLLAVLRNFEQEVEVAKGKARNAVSELESLEDALDEAEDKVEGAGEKLGDGQRDMGVVLTSIVEAKDNLEESLSNAKNVTGRIGELLSDSRTAASDAQDLETDVAAALNEIRRLRDEARNGTDLLKEALKNADNSKAVAKSIASTLESGDRKLKSIGKQLDDVDTVDAARLQELVNELVQAGDTLKESGVDDKIGEMTTISIEQDDKIAFYKAQIQLMREEILTLEKIELDLPDDSSCYNPNNV